MRFIKNNNNELYRDDKLKIVFERDCCFSAENIFFSSKDDKCPIFFNFEFLKLIKKGFKESKKNNRLNINGGPALDSPFGFSSNPRKPGEFIKYGRNHLLLQNDLGEYFMKLLYSLI